MRLYTLTSDLHGELAQNAHNEQFIKDIEAAVGQTFDYRETDFSDFGAFGDIIYVRTGGTEGIFKKVFEGHEGARVRLLTSGQSNSLAASMEILSWLNRQGLGGEILHGSVQEIASELLKYYPSPVGAKSPLVKPYVPSKALSGKRYGVVGHPSDWLISSDVDYAAAKEILGAELIDISIDELIDEVRGSAAGGSLQETSATLHPSHRLSILETAGPSRSRGHGRPRFLEENLQRQPESLKPLNVPKYGRPFGETDFEDSMKIYKALKDIAIRYSLDGLTLRCFDLLTALGNTGCMSLAMLNAEGLVATCEGDVPAMLSMALVREKYGVSGFQANLSKIDGDKYLFAHCTVPLDMVQDYCYDTHFESGIGVALHGILPLGKARIFKLGADLQHCINQEVEILDNPYGANLCRTQILVKAPVGLRNYFLRAPLGNHHIIVPEQL